MEKKEIILAEKEFNVFIQALGGVSAELLLHSSFFNELLKGNSVSDSQASKIKKLIKSTDIIQEMVFSCVMALGTSASRIPGTVDAFLNYILNKFQFEDRDQEQEMRSVLTLYFSAVLKSPDIDTPAERKNKDFAIEVKPNGIKN